MGYQELVLGKEAEAISGVSLTTLGRFVEAGYLQVETDTEGVPWYSKSELIKLFCVGGQDPGTRANGAQIEPEQSAPKASAEPDISETGEWNLAAEDPFENLLANQNPQPQVATDYAATVDGRSAGTSLAAVVEKIYSDSEPAIVAAQATQAVTPSPRGGNLLERELHRQRTVLELQEKLLDMRDKQIADLKEQRDWLQKRVERFEDKNERDQLLLLAETQSIRRLIGLQEERKSSLRLALEWLGFAKPLEQRKTNAPFIDIVRQSNPQQKAEPSGSQG